MLNSASSARLSEAAVDVTPVMNMFIILIPFLVGMAVFSHFSVLEFSLSSEGKVGRVADEAALPLTLALGTEVLTLVHGDRVLAELFRDDEASAFALMGERLVELSASLSGKDDIVIAVEDGVPFARIVASMDCCREAGFTEIGIAEGTGGDDENR